jgi:hypothetical protein
MDDLRVAVDELVREDPTFFFHHHDHEPPAPDHDRA